jgi:hypothetical protein
MTPAGTKGPSKLWLPVILAVSVLLGLILSFFVPVPPLFWRYAPFELQRALMIHVILSTVSIALLVSLAVIYLKVYSDTGARFALGIVVVLLALLIQSLIEYPLFLGLAVRLGPGEPEYYSYADFFTIIAYTIFLYLSLE